MASVDFDKVKASVSCVQAAQALGIQLFDKGNGQYRAKCPVCEDQKQGLSVHQQKGFNCFASKSTAKGSCINLVMHIQGVNEVQAAKFLAEKFLDEPKPKSVPITNGFKELDYLEADHEAVQVLGFDPEIAKKLGIGYASKGILRGKVAVPVRLTDGSLFGYIGIDDVTLPPSFRGANVVEIKTA